MTGFGHKLPDLVVDLNGQLHIVLNGRIDQLHGGLRTTFEAVPDAPVSRFVLALKGGAKGLIQNSLYLWNLPQRATATFIGHNAKSVEIVPPLEGFLSQESREAQSPIASGRRARGVSQRFRVPTE